MIFRGSGIRDSEFGVRGSFFSGMDPSPGMGQVHGTGNASQDDLRRR